MIDIETSEWAVRRLRSLSEKLLELSNTTSPEHPTTMKIIHQAAVANGTADVLERAIELSRREKAA